ncbi:MAG: peptidoglycan-binding domain-containing protein [Candidatus Liptonbacteria bacterium]|nr:peptidoglycan-binding domain-containing protein [Candidatus Liptonbacteria bacterium]
MVFTDLIPGEGAAAPSSYAAIAQAVGTPGTTSIFFNRSLGIGATGADVVALQTFLEQRGLLELPPGVTNGFFGKLTSAAIAKYQTSVGLPSVGIFGPLTRAKFNAELARNYSLPNTGETQLTTPGDAENLSNFTQDFIRSAGTLYATPMDGFTTSILFLSIVFVIRKIVRLRRVASIES